MRTSSLALLLFTAVRCYAQECAATPEAAAASIIAPAVAYAVDAGGYRVQDVQADPMTHRLWVRVSRCDDLSAPLILVPVRANLAGGAPPLQPAPLTSSAASSATSMGNTQVHVPAPMAVHGGDAVKAVFTSSNVRMEMDAIATGQAAMGGVVEIMLARRGDEPAHRMRGVLRAPGRVEVQP